MGIEDIMESGTAEIKKYDFQSSAHVRLANALYVVTQDFHKLLSRKHESSN